MSDKINHAIEVAVGNASDFYQHQIATLESEVAALKYDIERATQRNSDLIAENEALRAEIEGIREYAEMYKWLREHSWVEILFEHSIANFGPGYSQCKPEELDAAINKHRPCCTSPRDDCMGMLVAGIGDRCKALNAARKELSK